MCATCFIDEVINVARHSQCGCRMIRRPRQKSRAARIAGSFGNERQIFAERMIEREIVPDHFRGRAGEEETISPLLDVNAVRADRSHITVAALFPMEDLAGIERAREIEIRC